MKAFTTILIIIGILMFMTNPSMDDFGDYVADSQGEVDGMTRAFARNMIGMLFSRDNYYFLSTYTGVVDVMSSEPSNDAVFLGVFKKFIRIDSLLNRFDEWFDAIRRQFDKWFNSWGEVNTVWQ